MLYITRSGNLPTKQNANHIALHISFVKKKNLQLQDLNKVTRCIFVSTWITIKVISNNCKKKYAIYYQIWKFANKTEC